MAYDCIIIGSGPAGVSAALNLKIRNKDFLWLGSKNLSDKVALAEKIMNYPGVPATTGRELNEVFKKQISDMGIEITEQMVNSIVPMGDNFAVMAGPEFYEAKTIILTTGQTMKATIKNESELLGKGVSYCATCDGGLYRGRTIAVVSNNPRFEHEVKYLADLAEKVYFFPSYKGCPVDFHKNVTVIEGTKPVELVGSERVNKYLATKSDGENIEVEIDGMFILRDTISLSTLLKDLEIEEGHIKVDRHMATSIPGVFAAGDCTGTPYQYTKAVGEGNVAAHSVVSYLN